MDTKLKQRKFKLQVILVLLTVCIGTAIGSYKAIKNDLIDVKYYREYVKYEFENVFRSVNNLMLYTDGIYGELRNDSVDYEVGHRKEMGGLLKSDGITPMNDEEIKNHVVNEFNNYVLNEQSILRKCVNVEFYFDIDEGRQPFTNVNVSSKEEFEEDTLENYTDYIIIKSNREVSTSKRLASISRYLEGVRDNNGNLLIDYKHDIYIRVAQPMQEGDMIYEDAATYEKWRTYGQVSVGILIISLIGIVYSIIRLKKGDLKALLEGTLAKTLGKIDIEIKLLVLVFTIWKAIDIFKHSAYHLNIIKSVVIILVPIYFIILEFLRLKSTFTKFSFKDLRIKESLIRKIVNYVVKSGVFISIVFVMLNIAALYISAASFIASGAADYLGYNYDLSMVFAAIITLIFDEIAVNYLGYVHEIIRGIKRISEGNYNVGINVKGSKALKEIAGNLENIQDGLKSAVNKAVKSEKMKSELITNVSHDLKTPLTSIINYVDLLSQDNITEEQKDKYLKILKDKSNRLKVLIEDLFEVSKASSGNVELNMINLDPVSLIRQTLGEFEDKIENSDLKIIKKFPKEKVVAYADGRKTFRVFQNLISNILKYSMEGSRVYIEVNDNEEYVEVIFKNTSKEELNFTEEEILQRFKRGDTSRTTEGSGLGLAIAKSLIEVQKGEFNINIDGDLFKVIVKIRKEKN